MSAHAFPESFIMIAGPVAQPRLIMAKGTGRRPACARLDACVLSYSCIPLYNPRSVAQNEIRSLEFGAFAGLDGLRYL